LKHYSFVDEAEVYLKGGAGGEGSFSFYHYRNGHTQGNGGNGGRGGDVLFSVNTGLYDLTKLRQKKVFVGLNGDRGDSNNKNGRDGNSTYVELPLGTLIRDSRGALLYDLDGKEKTFLGAKGGVGAPGNYKKAKGFTSTPRQGEEVTYKLDLRILNDIALVGPPNTGKTQLISTISGKELKVTPFPYSTELPLWINVTYEFKTFTIMELPAMIKPFKKEYVNESFLRHLYRSKAIVIVSDSTREYKDDCDFIDEHLQEVLGDEYDKKTIAFWVNKMDLSKKSKKKEGKYTFVSAQDPKQKDRLCEYLLHLAESPEGG